MNQLSKGIGITTTVLIATFLMLSEVAAKTGPDAKRNAHNNSIVGLWDVVVQVDANCNGIFDGGEPAFQAMHKYELGGTGQIVPATNPANLSEHSMIWSHVRASDYRMTIKMFRFVSGAYVGWNVISNEVSIGGNAMFYVGSGVAEVFDTMGNKIGQSCPSFIGNRFTGE